MLTRQMYVPQNATILNDKESSAVVYLYERNGHICAAGFAGRRNKPDFQYRYATEEQRQNAINAHFDIIRKREQDKKARQAEKANFKHTLKAGDVLYTSWGYDQTNVDFYEVIEVKTKKTVVIRRIGQSTEENGFMSGQTSPIKGSFKGEPMTKRVQIGNVVTVSDSRGHASPWDGKPKYCSWYA